MLTLSARPSQNAPPVYVLYLHLTSPDYPGRTGIGECAPLPALSCDDLPDYEDILVKACRRLEDCGGDLDVES